MDKPQIVISDWKGQHNTNIPKSSDRLIKGNTYKDCSTIIVVPSRGLIHAKVVQCWMNLMLPMNQKAIRIFIIGMEVGEAYNAAVDMIISHPDLSKWKYMLTLEDDNMPPPDGIIKLYEGMEKFDAVSGLYWTKGEGGQPMIYGNPFELPKNFLPQVPVTEAVQQCNGLGMGFTMFRLSMFSKVPRPWFRTLQKYTPGVGSSAYTQDLFFFEEASKYGFKFACDTRIKVGHYDSERDIVW